MRIANLIAVVATALVVGAAGMDVTAEEESEDGPTAAPDFTLKDHHGKEVKLSDYHDKIVVLEWINPQYGYLVDSTDHTI
jgi:cytochrome oxidase Cu insertion factor (SCO1/SenC/PrrC family)